MLKKILTFLKSLKSLKLGYLFNTTIYKGKIKFYYTNEYPYYSNNKECMNGVIFKYKNKYFYTKIIIERDKIFGELYNTKKISKILKKCNVNINTAIYNFNLNKNINEYNDFRYIDKSKLNSEFFVIYTLYNKNGKYVGDLEHGNWLLRHNLIADDIEHGVAYNKKLKKYCGYTHRAAVYFGIGDKIFDENFKGNDDTLFNQHGEKDITNMEEAKISAKNFSKYMS